MSRQLRSIAGMSLGTLCSRLTGFAKWAMLGAVLGFTPLADAYNLAHILPNMIYELILGGILSAVFIPVVVEQLSLGDPERAWHDISQLVNAGLIILAATTALCWLGSGLLVDIQTIRLTPERRHLVWFFFVFFVPQVFFYGLSAIAGGILNARNRFAIAAFAPVLNNLIVIASLAAYRTWPGFGIVGLALGSTLGVLAQAVVQYPSMRRAGFRYYLEANFRHPAVAKIIKLSGPVILYVIFNQLNLTVQNNLAIRVPGGVSALQYAFAFYILPHGLLAVSIGTVLLPGLSDMAVRKDWAQFARTVERGIAWSAIVIVPALAAYVSLSFPIVQVLMQRGSFVVRDSQLLARVLGCYSLGLFSFTLYLFLNRVFYAMQDTRTPLVLNFTGNLANTLFNMAVIGSLAVPGLALGHAFAYTLIAVLSLMLIKRRIGEIRIDAVLLTLGKVLIASAVIALMGLLGSIWWRQALALSGLWAKAGILACMLAVMGAVYLGLARLLRIDEVTALGTTIRQRFVR